MESSRTLYKKPKGTIHMSYTLYHYFDKDIGPFRNLSSLSIDEAFDVSRQIKQDGKMFASQRSDDYMLIRRDLERIARGQFMAKGGKPKKFFPHYMTLGYPVIG
ncbi:hypothetical protein MUG84_15805 [Paenibacillus sp. KQZ6P-2]|uniref:Uncharacterized protein n=1 Tax=Paenibacillus mangrovi TaxID=2931978 RepID=A0A9X1WPY4_9BACL|nr:hypothetical protein [Paenibacillus mangrovi]MCJ8013197.1 hypothetical protein [Paenibacillus mangrovi]